MTHRILLLSLLAAVGISFGASKANERLAAAAETLSEIMDIKDQAIPEDLLNKAHCIVIIPGMKKGGFILGAQYGRGFLSCRKADGNGWTAPGAVRTEGGSVGLQIGGAETDVFMLVMNEKGKDKLLSSKFTLGGEAAAAAGPVGREARAQTDAQMRAEILTWSRSRGVFGGISLNGATLRPDEDVNEDLYGREITNQEIVTGGVPAPAAASELIALLDKYSSRESK